MSVRLRLLAVLGALLLPALLLHGRSGDAPGAALPAPAQLLPEQAGAWRVTDERRFDPAVLARAAPESYRLLRYEAPGRAPIWVYGAYHGARSARTPGAHDPEICFPAQGWEVLDAGAFPLALGPGETVAARFLEVEKDLRREAVLYWFQPASRWPTTNPAEELLRIREALAGRPQHAFVRLSTPVESGSDGLGSAAELARALAPRVRAALAAAAHTPPSRHARPAPSDDAPRASGTRFSALSRRPTRVQSAPQGPPREALSPPRTGTAAGSGASRTGRGSPPWKVWD